jgi:hypothetical protein
MRQFVLGSTLTATLAVCAGCSKDKTDVDDGTIVTPYLAIADTLARDEIERLPQMGAVVIKAAEAHQGEPGVDAIVQGASRVGAQDIATARTAIKKMSHGMIEYVAANPDQQAGHMIVHCTMTFAGDGAAWVQKEGPIMNPYEGAMMLHCGDKVAWGDEVPEF